MAEKRTIELEIQDNSKSLKQQYREAVQELQKLSQQYGETSDQAVKAAKAAAELKDQIEFSKDLIKGFNPDAKFAAAEGAINGVMNGIQAFEGGLALIGVESDKVQEAMLRVQSVMALTQGINGLMQAKDAFAAMGTVARTALKGIKTELIATGIGAFVVALGTVVAYWDEIKGAVSGVSEEQKELNKKVDKQATASKEIYENAQLQENSLRLQGKSEKEILKIRIGKLNTAIADEEARIKGLEATAKLEYDAAVRNREYAEMFFRLWLEGQALIFRAMVAPIDMVLSTANKVSEALGLGKITTSTINEEITKLTKSGADFFAGLLFDPKETKAKSDATIKEANKGLAQMKSDRDGLLLEIKKSDQQSFNSEKETGKEKLDLERENIDKRLALMADGYDKEVALAKEKNKREKEDLLASSKDKIVDAKQLADAEKLIDETLKKELRQLQLKYDNADIATWEEKHKKENDQKKLEIEAELAAAGKRIEIREAEAEKKKKIDEEELQRRNELRQKTLELAGNTFSALADLAGSFNTKNEKDARKQFQIQKAFNLGAAITNTAMAVTGALTAGGNPIKLATGQQFVEAAIAATIGAANIIKIANSKFGGGGSSSSGGGGGSNAPASSPMTANFNTIGSSGINQLAQLQQTPTQAYVVSGEVTSAQALDRNRVQNATL
jgi:hypothetical protein